MADAQTYQELLLGLLPSGSIWPRDPDTTLGQLMGALAEELARTDSRLWDLIDEADPRTTFELLSEWETLCGLPEECDYSGTTLIERRAAVHQKLTALGGQSPAYFISIAERLGYEVEITEHRPALAGVCTAGQPCNGEEWAHAWQVGAPETTVFPAKAGGCQAGDRVRTWGNEKLECAISAKKPAHTVVLFAYGA